MYALILALLLAFPQSDDLRHRVFHATGILYAQDETGGMKMRCTATVFERTDDGYNILTASHCVGHDDVPHKHVQLYSTPFYFSFDEEVDDKVFMPATVEFAGYQSAGDDFSVLHVKTKRELTSIAIGDDTKVEAGEDIINVASPLGLGRQTFAGSVTMRSMSRPVMSKDINWNHAMLLQINVAGGSSGSAVISLKQEAIIAVLVGTIQEGGTPMVIAIPISRFVKVRQQVADKKYKFFDESSREAGGDDGE